EAALFLAQSIIEKPDARKDKTWYILPQGNTDAAVRFFKKPLFVDPRNTRPYNDDMDDRVDEDGFEDLDGNGFITSMRVKDPEGQWMTVEGEPRLMKKADWAKGEKGSYKLYTEGIDNDGDGQYNEDGPGGVNAGINYPHLFEHFSKTSGAWPGSEAETRSIIKFIYQHPEIAMTITFGSSNFCMAPPKGGRKGSVDFSKIKIPERIAKRFNFDHTRTYTMAEIMEKVQKIAPPGMNLTESMVASFMGLGAAVNPQAADLKFYNEISEEYKKFLEENKLKDKRLDTAPAKDGCFELWSYYQLTVPTFSLDFWTLPEVKKEKKKADITPEKLEAMSKEDFLALGEEKIAAFLKKAGAPIKAKPLMDMVKGGMMTTKKMAGMLKKMGKSKSSEGADEKEKAILAFSDKQLEGKGFIKWKSFKHPSLGQVEIGGPVPFVDNTPPPSMIKNLLQAQMPWVFKLVNKIPRITIAKTKVKSLGSGLYRLTLWVGNDGYLPYRNAMGKRNKRLPPVVVTLSGNNYKIIEGHKRNLIKSIPGNGVAKTSWIILAKQPVKINLKATSPNAYNDSAAVSLGGVK
ncbi:MAG: hypothetical protein GY757_59925, partial [bacterium]|nr:hypothetical protein [bacterium]